MPEQRIYAPPRQITNIEECYFYHKTDLPGHGVVGGEWDLRGSEEAYLGGVCFAGKRVLELGTASGFLCRYMESKGAEVVCFDLSDEGSWDLVPFAQVDLTGFAGRFKDHIRRLNNSWWFSHRMFHSKAKVVYGNIYDIPKAIGPVDISTFGAILIHLRDPFLALQNALRLTKETVVVTDVAPDQPPGSAFAALQTQPTLSRKIRNVLRRIPASFLSAKTACEGANRPAMIFAPNGRQASEERSVSWWILSPEVIVRFLEVLGFEDTKVSYHMQKFCSGGKVRFYTVVGNRTRSMPPI